MKRDRNTWLHLLVITSVSAVLFIPFLGNCHLFDWDEVNFAECAREMIVTGDYSHVQMHFRPFWEKPPLFIWMQAASMKVFGVGEFAARFPNALCALATFITLYFGGKRFFSAQFGLTWCLLYAACLLPHLYFRSGLIDPWFNLFTFLSVYNLLFVINNPEAAREWIRAVLAGIFLGLAVLTKGPAALLVVALTIGCYALLRRDARFFRSPRFLFFAVTSVAVASSWFIAEALRGNGDVVVQFLRYQKRLLETGDAGHDGPWFYHVVVLLVGCFPASIIFIASYTQKAGLTPFQLLHRQLILYLFWVVLVVFSVVKTKIVHYSSLCYFPLTFVATCGIVVFREHLRWRKFLQWLFWIITALTAIAYLLITTIEQYKNKLISTGWINDAFAVENLRTNVHWYGFEPLFVLLLLAGSALVHRGITRRNQRHVMTGLIAQGLFVAAAIGFIVPRVEMYTQNAAVAFYKSCSGRDVDVETHRFKSYAYLFYSKRQPSDFNHPQQTAYIENQLDLMVSEGRRRITSFATANMLWAEYGQLHRPAVFVARSPDEADILSIRGMKKLYDQNGYGFFIRLPEPP